jgi:hypothetical protein
MDLNRQPYCLHAHKLAKMMCFVLCGHRSTFLFPPSTICHFVFLLSQSLIGIEISVIKMMVNIPHVTRKLSSRSRWRRGWKLWDTARRLWSQAFNVDQALHTFPSRSTPPLRAARVSPAPSPSMVNLCTVNTAHTAWAATKHGHGSLCIVLLPAREISAGGGVQIDHTFTHMAKIRNCWRFIYFGHEQMHVLVLLWSKLKKNPNMCVSLVLVSTNTPKILTPPRGGKWPVDLTLLTLFSLSLCLDPQMNETVALNTITYRSKHPRC